MTRRVLLSGLAGAVVLCAWTFAVNVGFGFTARLEMQPVPNERAVYALLKEHISRPGAYMANPPLSPRGEFPPGEPAFSIRYSGVGHDAAGRLLLIDLAVALAASILAAGLLSTASTRILSRYPYKVMYVATVGLLLAVFGDLPKFGIGGYPASTALLLAGNHALSWTLSGAVMAWAIGADGDAPRAAASSR
jgi:hypothetical protein